MYGDCACVVTHFTFLGFNVIFGLDFDPFIVFLKGVTYLMVFIRFDWDRISVRRSVLLGRIQFDLMYDFFVIVLRNFFVFVVFFKCGP